MTLAVKIICVCTIGLLSALGVWWLGYRHRMTRTDLYGSGLNRAEWLQLKDVLLSDEISVARLQDEFNKLPGHLQNHAVGTIIKQYLDDPTIADLEEAAALLVNGANNAWLILSKS